MRTYKLAIRLSIGDYLKFGVVLSKEHLGTHVKIGFGFYDKIFHNNKRIQIK